MSQVFQKMFVPGSHRQHPGDRRRGHGIAGARGTSHALCGEAAGAADGHGGQGELQRQNRVVVSMEFSV